MRGEPLIFDEARDCTQQAVTAVLHRDRSTSGDLVAAFPDHLALSLVLVDFAAYVHRRWCDAVGMDDDKRMASWTELMTDTEEWRMEVSDV